MPIGKKPVYTNIFKKGEKLKSRQLFKMGSTINPIVEENSWDETDTSEHIDGQFTDRQKELIARLSENVIDSKKFLKSIIDYRQQVYNYKKKSGEKEEYIGCHTPFSSETKNRHFWYKYVLQYNRGYIDKYGFNGCSVISLEVNDSECSIDCYMFTNEHLTYDSMEYEEFIAANPDIDLEPLRQQIQIAKELGYGTMKIPKDLQSSKEEKKYITQKPVNVR